MRSRRPGLLTPLRLAAGSALASTWATMPQATPSARLESRKVPATVAMNGARSTVPERPFSMARPAMSKPQTIVEGKRKDQVIHLVDGGTHTIRSAMHVLEEELRPAGFIRVHQGFLVNYRQIKLIEDQEVSLLSGERLPISRRKSSEVRALYLELIQQNNQMVF